MTYDVCVAMILVVKLNLRIGTTAEVDCNADSINVTNAGKNKR